ncbi:hypothetical protein ABHN11_24460 [Brevibacillus centrosporus]|uniref:hypothetical protein n=1 Tax=Brevibacillus centrosporus TaxID=54910 RepID=UPI003D1A1939
MKKLLKPLIGSAIAMGLLLSSVTPIFACNTVSAASSAQMVSDPVQSALQRAQQAVNKYNEDKAKVESDYVAKKEKLEDDYKKKLTAAKKIKDSKKKEQEIAKVEAWYKTQQQNVEKKHQSDLKKITSALLDEAYQVAKILVDAGYTIPDAFALVNQYIASVK